MTARTFQRPRALNAVYRHKGGAAPTATHYCPGCGHGVIHKLIGAAIDEAGVQDRTIVVSPVGCAVFAYYYFDTGNVQVPHGRAPAAGTGLSRARDDAVVLLYQGDGDLASIGLNETIQAANRGEKMAVFFVNNTVYGMTGGQMAPTTLMGEVTATSPEGRNAADNGYPIHMCELLATLNAPVYIERVSVSDVAHIRKAKKAIQNALDIQRDGLGYAFIEILSNCPTNLKQDNEAQTRWINDHMEKEFPLGVYRDRRAEATPKKRPAAIFDKATLDRLYELDAHAAPEAPVDAAFGTIGVKMAGFGGQGVLSMGVILTRAACEAKRFTSWFPSYGPEQRGGTANCSVRVSGQPVGSPTVAYPDVLVALNRPSLERFAGDVVPGGWIVYDDSIEGVTLPSGVRGVAAPARALAREAGNERMANTAMLGVLLGLDATRLPREAFESAIRANFAEKPALVPGNIKALDLAAAWAASHRQG